MNIGREIFLQQLSTMYLNEKIIDDMCDTPQELIQTFKVPESHISAFHAYYLDYLTASGDCTNEFGTFRKDDIYMGIRDKLIFFYKPIIEVLKVQQEELKKISLKLVTEPLYDGPCSVIVIAENTFVDNEILPCKTVLLEEYPKAWGNWFMNPGDPKSVYVELAKTYYEMFKEIKKLKSAWGVQ